MIVRATPEVVEMIAKMQDEKLRGQVDQLVHVTQEQTKMVDNYAAENRRLRAELAKLRKKDLALNALKRIELSRTKSKDRKRSAWLGLREGLLYAPLTFAETAGWPLVLMTGALLIALGTAMLWVIARPIILIGGLLGFVVDRQEKKA